MGFLAPALLGLAALAGVPVLVHLLRRRVGRTVDFPAVRYLTRMEQEHSRELKLKHRLLLFLRVLVVLALALAAARPIARLAGLGHAPVALALVVDNSMSSAAVHEGRAVLDDLKRDGAAMLGALTPDDRAWLVTADGRVTGGNAEAVSAALAALRPLHGRGDLAAATRRAAALARSGAPRAPVVALVSDGQANAMQPAGGAIDPGAATVMLDDVPLVALVAPRAPIGNRAVLAATPEPARWTPAGAVSFAVSSPDSASWRVLLDGRTVARGTAAAGTVSAPTRVAQRTSSATTGWVRGSVELDADELRGDDVRWFAVRAAAPPSVAVRPEAGPFASTALATLVEERRLARGAEGAPGVVTVAGADAPGVRGTVLLTAPLDPVRVGEANRTLARLGIPWRFGAIARDLVLARVPGADSGRGDGAAAPPLDGVPVRLRYPLVRSPGAGAVAGAARAAGFADTLAMAGGVAWAVAGPDYVLLGSPLEPDATDLPVRAAFVPWLLDALSRRLGDDGRVVQAAPGARLAGFSGVTALERQDGSLVTLSGDRLVAPAEPGVYFLRRETARVGALVVNPEPEESVLGQEGAGVIDSATTVAMLQPVRGGVTRVARTADAWRDAVFESANGRSLLVPLVALALLALLLETWFARERAGQDGARVKGRGWPLRRGAPASRAA